MTTEVKEIPCATPTGIGKTCGHAKTIHEPFKNKLACGVEGCPCGNFTDSPVDISSGGSGDWFSDIVEAGLDGLIGGIRSHVKKKMGG